jgi:Ca-activated chloride channel family protein
MNLLAPLAATLLLLVPVLVVFYLLKVRRQDYEVGSTLLWRHLTRDVTAHEPWQRLRWNPLLLLQALVMLAIIGALVRPYLARAGATTGFEVLVLDGSASMEATDVAPSRFDAAKAAARNLIDRLPAGAQAAIIEVAATPRTLVGGTADRSTMDAALAAARPTVSVTNMRASLEVALALARSHRDSRIDVFSDGAFANIADFGDSGVPIHFVTIGGQGQNEGITALSARPEPTSPGKVSVFVRVANDTTHPANNQVALLTDGQQLESKAVTAAAGASQGFVFDNVPDSAHIVEAKLQNGDDLAADNQAYLILQRRPPPRVLLVSTGNRFLTTALRFLSIQLFQVTPNQLGSVNADSYDVVVLDNVVPSILPKGNLLLIDPPNSPLLPTTGTVGPIAATNTQSSDALLANVDLSTLQVLQAAKVTVPSWARVLADANGTPLLLTGQTQGRTIIALPFAVQQSNLWGLPTFPILMANAMAELAPHDSNGLVQASQTNLLLVQPLPGVDRIDVQRPDGTTVPLPLSKVQSIAYGDTDRAGLYVVTQHAGSRVLSQQTYAVNLLSSEESNINTLPPPAFAGQGASSSSGPGAPAISPYELWPYLALLGALLLLGEWWWYHRRA